MTILKCKECKVVYVTGHVEDKLNWTCLDCKIKKIKENKLTKEKD